MLGAIARSGGRSRARACADFLRDALRSGISAAAATLFERYEAELRTGTVSYDTWVRMYDTFSKAELAALRERAERHAGGPLISVLVPVYDTPERWLRRCLDSVLAQAYRNWELCIAVAARARCAARVRAQGSAHPRGPSRTQWPHLGRIEQRSGDGTR
jgi:cellulose synthase/poly-beta-1,6-N-acetylglucosamine synthase-like glycosyltransferase